MAGTRQLPLWGLHRHFMIFLRRNSPNPSSCNFLCHDLIWGVSFTSHRLGLHSTTPGTQVALKKYMTENEVTASRPPISQKRPWHGTP